MIRMAQATKRSKKTNKSVAVRKNNKGRSSQRLVRSYNDRKFIQLFHHMPFGLSLCIALLMAFVAAFAIFSNQPTTTAQSKAPLLFDGSKVANWGNSQVGSKCGSSIRDISEVPPGKSGTSIQVTLADNCISSIDLGKNPRERAELLMPIDKLQFKEGTVWYVDFWQRFDQLASGSGDWDIWHQHHYYRGGQPNIIFASDSGKRMKFKTSIGCGHSTHWNGPAIETGKWYHFTLGVKYADLAANGWIELKVDGQTVVKQKPVATLNSSQSVCSGNFDGNKGYPKKGIYRNAAFSGTEQNTTYGFRIYGGQPPASTPNPSPDPTPAPPPSNPNPDPYPDPDPEPAPPEAPKPQITVRGGDITSCKTPSEFIPNGCADRIIDDPLAQGQRTLTIGRKVLPVYHTFTAAETDDYRIGYSLRSKDYRGPAKINVYLDGKLVKENVTIDGSKYNYYYLTRKLAVGKHTFKVEFINDKCGNFIPREPCDGKHDRNLLVDYWKLIQL